MYLDAAQISKKLGYQAPLNLLDEVSELKKNEYILAKKSISMNESFFQGHFPNNPVMPGVLIIEAMVEAAKLMWADQGIVLTNIKKGRFREMVKPGTQLIIKIESTDAFICKAKAVMDDKVACTAELSFNNE